MKTSLGLVVGRVIRQVSFWKKSISRSLKKPIKFGVLRGCERKEHSSHKKSECANGEGYVERPQPSKITIPSQKSSSVAIEQYLLNLVDLLDEISLIRSSLREESKPLNIVESRLKDLITLSDGIIIKETEWNPDRQRAVKIVSTTAAKVEIITSYCSGLEVNGKIVRKEAVVLSRNPISQRN